MADFNHTVADGGVQVFRLNKNDRATLDAFMVKFEEVLVAHREIGYIALIIDLRPRGLPPITYSIGKIRETFARVDNPPQIYAAYLYQQSFVIGLISSLLDTLRLRTTRKFFYGDREEEATQWLIDRIYEFTH
jgi:hypothetical protein